MAGCSSSSTLILFLVDLMIQVEVVEEEEVINRDLHQGSVVIVWEF